MFQESAKRLEQLQAGFSDATTALSQIFKDLNLIADFSIPARAPSTVKYAASAAIIAEVEEAIRQATQSPDGVTVAVQLAKIGDKVRVALPGGAILSNQEADWISAPENAGKQVPGNLFYVLAQDQLSSTGRVSFDYNIDLAAEGFTASLRQNLARELGEELGDQAAHQVTFGQFLPGQRTTTLTSMKLPDADVSKQIEARLRGDGVTLDEKGTLRGIYTVVTEKVAVAHVPLEEIAKVATDNTEAKGMRVKSLGELLRLSRQTAESIDTYRDFKKHHADRHGSDGVRNPSMTWGLSLLAGWLKERVIAADPYREGARSNPPTDKK